MSASSGKQPVRPRTPRAPKALCEIRLPERGRLLGDAMFVKLATLDQLMTFWEEHRTGVAFWCTGAPDGGDAGGLLDRYDWVFAASKWAVAAAVLRLGHPGGITCEFYDWAAAEPADHEGFWRQREKDREERISVGTWTESDESEHQRVAPDVYRGWWCLRNPYSQYESLDPMLWAPGEVCDPSLTSEEAARRLCEQVFDQWARDLAEVAVGTAAMCEEYIKRQQAQRAAGQPHYGNGDVL